jgi:AcrR family transcriptional regulator
MPIEDRKLRDRAAQRRLITTTARALAEQEGWNAVTTRRLATEIEYSQPVIYKHFASMEDVIEAVALEGFGELAEVLRAARGADGPREDTLARVARSFDGFAAENPAVYDAMFTRATRLRFAGRDTPAPLVAAFVELREAVAVASGDDELETRAELFWSALHGLTTLSRGGRLRPGAGSDRLEALVARFSN